MPAHSTLTGADLHEPKGIDIATANQVYVANGTGSGTWQTRSNKYISTIQITDVSTPDVILVPVPNAAILNKCTVIINNAITLVNSTLTFTNSLGPTVIGTLAIAFTASAEGSIFTFAPVTDNTFTAGSYLKIVNDGASTTTAKATLLLEWTLT